MLAPPEPKDDSRPFSSQVSQTAPSSAGRIEQPKHDYRKPAPTIPLKGAYRNSEPLHPTCHHTNRNKNNAPLTGRQYLFSFLSWLEEPRTYTEPCTNGQRDQWSTRPLPGSGKSAYGPPHAPRPRGVTLYPARGDLPLTEIAVPTGTHCYDAGRSYPQQRRSESPKNP